MNKIYNLDLHEVLVIEESIGKRSTMTVTRVPGGWIYTTSGVSRGSNEVSFGVTSTFVPFDDEFKIGNREE